MQWQPEAWIVALPAVQIKRLVASRHRTQPLLDIATESAVLCLPGSVFGEGQQDCLRIAVANLEAEQMVVLGERLASLRA